MATPAVGSDIEDICTKCGDTWHVVVAKVGERVIKVICKMCGVQHQYRGDKTPPASASKATGTRKRATKKLEPVAPVIPSFDPSKPPRPYSVKELFQAGDRIEHPSFGTGIVAGSPGAGKVDVVFPTGARTLACAKAESTLARPTFVERNKADRPPDSPPPRTPGSDDNR